MKCLECQSEFIPEKRHPFQKFCSNKCGQKYIKRNNRERYSQYEKDRYHRDPKGAQKRSREYLLRTKKKIFKLLGNKCSNPYGMDHGDFLEEPLCFQIDHVDGGGSKERRKLGATCTYYVHILRELGKGSRKYQLLCANCNWIKKNKEKEI